MSVKSINPDEYSNLDDPELVRLAQSGDGQAMEHLLLRYKKMVKRKASRLFIAGGDYEDVIQEGMIGLFKAVRDFDFTKNVAFSSFAVYCVLSQIYDAVKTAARKKHESLNLSISLDGLIGKDEEDQYCLLDVYIDLSRPGPYEQIITKEEIESLNTFISEELTKNERQALLLFIEGYSYAQIAQKLGRTKKSIDSAMSRSREKFEVYKKQNILY